MRRFPGFAVIALVAGLAAMDVFGATVRGRVDRQTSYGAVPATSVKVTIRNAGGKRSSPIYTNSHGTYYIYNVPAGNYVLEAWSGTRATETPITVGNVATFNAPVIRIR